MFDNPTWLHGVNHTCRVMALTWALGSEMALERERNLALCAAYIHDTARQGDGVCSIHGERAAIYKLPLYKDFFLSQGIDAADIPVIKSAIINHSQPEDLEKNHPHYLVTALLKDSDALDRFRLGPFNLKKKYLRFPQTRNYIKFAKELFFKTSCNNNLTFIEALQMLQEITGKKFPAS